MSGAKPPNHPPVVEGGLEGGCPMAKGGAERFVKENRRRVEPEDTPDRILASASVAPQLRPKEVWLHMRSARYPVCFIDDAPCRPVTIFPGCTFPLLGVAIQKMERAGLIHLLTSYSGL